MADRLGAKYQLQKSIAPNATMCHLMSTGWVMPSRTNNKASVARAMTTASRTAHIRRTNVATIIISSVIGRSGLNVAPGAMAEACNDVQ